MICSVCIATYKRKQLLRRLLDSILTQNLPENIELQVIVVDNDEVKSAKEVVQSYNDVDNIKFEYHVQPEKNISLTRNVAVNNAVGEYLFFIDDDERADADWIKNHLESLNEYSADGCFGIVLPKFHNDTPEWIKSGNYFARDCPPTGDDAIYMGTGNSIIKTKIINQVSGPFDPDYGITGGEDTHLFAILRRNGAKLISTRKAIVTELFSSDRTNIRWLFKKSFQTGNTATRRMIENSNSKLLKKIDLLSRAVTFEILSIIFFIMHLYSIKMRIKWLMKIASNAGHIAAILGINYKGYK